MAYGCREVRIYACRAPDTEAVVQAARECGFRPVSLAFPLLVFKVRASWWSWGETFEVFIGRVGNRVILDVQSRSALRWAIVDAGKNGRNIRRFFAALNAGRGGEWVYETARLCQRCGYPVVEPAARRCPDCGSAALVTKLEPGWRSILIGALWGVAILTAAEYLLVCVVEWLGFGALLGSFSRPLHALVRFGIGNTVILCIVLLLHAWVQQDFREGRDQSEKEQQ